MLNTIKKYLDQLERDIPYLNHGEFEIGGQIASLIQSENDRQDMENVAEVIAFNLTTVKHHTEETDGENYYQPMLVSKNESGEVFTDPDISRINEDILGCWKVRAQESKNPVLKGRYADLVVDFSPKLLKKNASADFYRTVIDSNIDICHHVLVNEIGCKGKIRRALKLAIKINDQDRIAKTKDAVLALEKRIAVDGKPGLWGFSFKWLLLEFSSKVKLSDDEKSQLVNDLEERLEKLNDTWPIENVVGLLAEHYGQKKDEENLMRVLAVLEKTFKSDGRWNSEPLLTQSYYEQLADIYAKYGSFFTEASKASNRIKHEYSQLNLDWQKSMKTISASMEIPQEKISKFLKDIFDKDGHILRNVMIAIIQSSCLRSKEDLRKELEDSKKQYPIQFLVTKSIISDDGIVMAKLFPEDQDGHLKRFTYLTIQSMLLPVALIIEELKKRFPATEIVKYFQESLVFENENEDYMKQAVSAYWENNYLVASHLFVPMIETGFRELIKKIGGKWLVLGATTGTYKNLSLSKLLSDDENSKRLHELFQNDWIFYIKLILVDRLGFNLRNDWAHGLNRENFFKPQNADLLFYILVILSLLVKSDGSEN